MDDFQFQSDETYALKYYGSIYLPNECFKLIDNYLPYTFKDSNELKEAVLLWRKNKEEAIQKYGSMKMWNVRKVTNFAYLFIGMSTFNEDISSWNVSNAETMQQMFYCCLNFSGDLSSWDVSNVKNMDSMFCACHKFNCDLSTWDVNNVQTMRQMFYCCSTFSQDLSAWDNVICNKKGMFNGCKSLNN